MSTVITAGNATNGLSFTADNAGTFDFKTGTGAGTTAMTIDASQNVAVTGNLTLTGNASGIIKSGTAVASTSGTSIDFTGIPSTAKRITVMFSGVSTNGSSIPIVQLGTSSGVETTSYISQAAFSGATNSCGGTAYTTGFAIASANLANLSYGHMTITLVGSNIWVSSHIIGSNSAGIIYSLQGAGTKTTAATLDRVRITTVNGTDTFDAGTINIFYEQSKSCTE